MTTIFTPFAEEWLNTLENGNYQQAKGILRSRYDKYCCFGVACDLNDSKLWGKNDEYHSYFDAVTYLPDDVRVKLGLVYSNGDFTITREFLGRLPKEMKDTIRNVSKLLVKGGGGDFPPNYCTIAALNDSGVTFTQIAAVVRARPKGLFIEDNLDI